MKKIRLQPASSQKRPRIMVFAEGTVLKPKSFWLHFSHRAYVPIGQAVQLLSRWEAQGADIIYCTSRKGKQAEKIAELLQQFSFPGNYLVAREAGEKYADLVEGLKPDVLIEDDCKSIGGAWQMCITKVEPQLKAAITSIVVPEFQGISHLPDKLQDL